MDRRGRALWLQSYSKVSGISGFGYKRRGRCQISGSGISVRGGVERFGYKRMAVYSAPRTPLAGYCASGLGVFDILGHFERSWPEAYTTTIHLQLVV